MNDWHFFVLFEILGYLEGAQGQYYQAPMIYSELKNKATTF